MATTPAKAAPAKKAAKKAAPPALDLTTLTVSEAPAPTRQSGVSTADNPFVQPMRDSWAKKVEMTPARNGNAATYKGAGKKIERVPNANVVQVQNLVRRAAIAVGNEQGVKLGAAIQVVELGNGNKGFSNILFAAKSAKQGKPRKTTVPAA